MRSSSAAPLPKPPLRPSTRDLTGGYGISSYFSTGRQSRANLHSLLEPGYWRASASRNQRLGNGNLTSPREAEKGAAQYAQTAPWTIPVSE